MMLGGQDQMERAQALRLKSLLPSLGKREVKGGKFNMLIGYQSFQRWQNTFMTLKTTTLSLKWKMNAKPESLKC